AGNRSRELYALWGRCAVVFPGAFLGGRPPRLRPTGRVNCMCGRFTLSTPPSAVAEHFELAEIPALTPRFNIAPTQSVATVPLSAGGERQLSLLRWGLVPSWADDPAIGNRLLNARAETVAAKPAFRAAFRQRRCLVVADGFFEWQKVGRQKQPYHFRLRD